MSKKSEVRVGVIHAYPNNFLVDSLKKANCEIVIVKPPLFPLNNSDIEAVIEVPLHDQSLVIKEVVDYHQKKPFDVLLPIYEGSTAITAKLSELLGLPGVKITAAQASRNKYLSYKCWSEKGIPVPSTVPIRDAHSGWKEIETHIGYPAIVKLADSMNSQGVIKVKSKDEYLKAIDTLTMMLEKPVDLDLKIDRNRIAYGSSEIKIIAQEYCSGIEVGVDCVVVDKDYIILGMFEKAPATGPYFAESMSISPTSLGKAEEEKIGKIAADAVLALCDGSTRSAGHVEIRFTPDGPKVLEAGLRPGGTYTAAAIEYITGINPYVELLNVLLGNEPSIVKESGKAVLYGGIVIPQSGLLKNVTGLEIFDTIPEILDFKIFHQPGDKVYSLPESAQPHFTHYLFGGSSREEVLNKNHLIQNSIQLEILDLSHTA